MPIGSKKIRSHIQHILLASLLATAEAAPIIAEEVHRFDVVTADAAAAIQQFGAQSGIQILADGEGLRGKRLNAVTGEHSIDEALKLLLAGTGLSYRYVGERGVALVPQAEQQADAEPAAASATTDQSSDAEPADTPSTQMSDFSQDEVIVVGSRLRSSAAENLGRVTTFYRDDIERLGVTNVADVLNYLPQQPFSVNEQNSVGGSRSVRLRGLGVGTTLVLVNGRRTVTSAITVAGNVFDLNSVPLSIVERVEVLSDSASAVYGADAVGGVINIVLKETVDAPFANLYYGMADGGADERRAALGFGWSRDRARMSFMLDAFDREFLRGIERERSANQNYTRFTGGSDLRSRASNPGTITARSGNLNGVGANFAAVPQGSTGVGLTPADFQATAGQRNLASVTQFSSVVPQSDRLSGILHGSFDLGADMQLFGEFMYTDRGDERLAQPSFLSAANTVVPAANPFNPFGQPVGVDYLFTGVGPQRVVNDSELFRGVVGAIGEMGKWEWELSVLDIAENGTGSTRNAVNLTAARASLLNTDPAQTLNVFQDGPGGSPSFLASLLNPVAENDFSSDALQGTVYFRGPALSLPAGTVDVVVGAETRKENIHIENQTANLDLTVDRDASAAFAEIRVPLVHSDMHIPLMQRLAVTVAGRYDDYSDFGSTFNPQLGLEWGFIPQLMLRGSFGTSFRPPSLFELYNPPTVIPGTALDPRRGNLQTPVMLSAGGNQSLDAEESDSYSVGLVFASKGPSRLSAALTYWDIHQDQRVQALDIPTLLANESLLSSRVVRAAPSSDDIAANRPGQLLSLDVSSLNFGTLDTSGIDLQLTGTFDTRFGNFAPNVAATWVNDYVTQNFLNQPSQERVDIASSQGTVPEYRATATLAWSLRGLTVAPTVRYIPSYSDVNGAGVLTGLSVGSQTLIDLQTSLDFEQFFGGGPAWLEGFKFRLGAINLTDKAPPFATVGGTQGYDTSQGDLRQRYIYTYLQKTF